MDHIYNIDMKVESLLKKWA